MTAIRSTLAGVCAMVGSVANREMTAIRSVTGARSLRLDSVANREMTAIRSELAYRFTADHSVANREMTAIRSTVPCCIRTFSSVANREMTAIRSLKGWEGVTKLKCSKSRDDRNPQPARGRAQPCLLTILGFLPFRIPACFVPILFWNVLSIWTRSTKAWMRFFPVNGI